MTRGTAMPAEAGKTCPYCRFALKAGAAVERCDSCRALHHAECWDDGRGCAVVGCSEGPTAQIAPRRAENTRVLPPYVEPSRPSPPALAPHGNRTLLIGVVAGLLIAAGLVIGFLATEHGTDPPKADATTAPATTRATTTTKRPIRPKPALVLPDGVYRWTVTAQDLEAEGRSAKYIAENTGVMTMSLAGGVWTFDQRSPTARHTLLTGRYDLTRPVVRFTVTGPAGDDEIGEAFSATWKLQGNSVVLSNFSSPDWGGVMGAHPWRRVG